MLAELMTRIAKAREVRRDSTLTRAEFEAREAREVSPFREPRARALAVLPADHRRSANIDVDRCVPGDFPVLTKSILMQSFDQIVTAPGVTKAAVADFLTRSKDPNDLFLGKYRVIHTSGSSGEVGYFVYSALDWARATMGPRRGAGPSASAKASSGSRYFAAIDGHYAGVTMVSSFRRGLVKLFVDIGLFEVNSRCRK